MDPHFHSYVIDMAFMVLDTSHLIGPSSRVWLRDDVLRHTFHLSVVEMMITLQDVAIILGHMIHGPQVANICDFVVSSLC